MACIQIKSQLRRLSAVQVVQLFRVIRSPSNGQFLQCFIVTFYLNFNLDTPAGRLIISDIIPAISILCSKFSIKFTTMFASTMLRDFSQPLTVMSDNIIASDAFFDCIAFEYVNNRLNLLCFTDIHLVLFSNPGIGRSGHHVEVSSLFHIWILGCISQL